MATHCWKFYVFVYERFWSCKTICDISLKIISQQKWMSNLSYVSNVYAIQWTSCLIILSWRKLSLFHDVSMFWNENRTSRLRRGYFGIHSNCVLYFEMIYIEKLYYNSVWKFKVYFHVIYKWTNNKKTYSFLTILPKLVSEITKFYNELT